MLAATAPALTIKRLYLTRTARENRSTIAFTVWPEMTTDCDTSWISSDTSTSSTPCVPVTVVNRAAQGGGSLAAVTGEGVVTTGALPSSASGARNPVVAAQIVHQSNRSPEYV